METLDKIHLTILGIGSYAVLRSAYRGFYSSFGVAPEEVGLSYVDTLARSAPQLVVGAAVVIFVALAMEHLLDLRGLQNPRRALHAFGPVALLLVLLIAMPSVAQEKADIVQSGYPISPGRLDLLDITARPVRAELLSELDSPEDGFRSGEGASDEAVSNSGEVPLKERDTLIYLGQSPETIILYDYRQQETLRLPTQGVAIRAR